MASDPLLCRTSSRPPQWTGLKELTERTTDGSLPAELSACVGCVPACACKLTFTSSPVGELRPVSLSHLPILPSPRTLKGPQGPRHQGLCLSPPGWPSLPWPSLQPDFLAGPVLLSHFLCRCSAVCTPGTLVPLRHPLSVVWVRGETVDQGRNSIHTDLSQKGTHQLLSWKSPGGAGFGHRRTSSELCVPRAPRPSTATPAGRPRLPGPAPPPGERRQNFQDFQQVSELAPRCQAQGRTPSGVLSQGSPAAPVVREGKGLLPRGASGLPQRKKEGVLGSREHGPTHDSVLE